MWGKVKDAFLLVGMLPYIIYLLFIMWWYYRKGVVIE